MKLTRVRRQIPSLKLDPNLLSDLCKMLDSEYKNKKPAIESYIYGTSYRFSNSETIISEKDYEKFLRDVPPVAGNVELKLEVERFSIDIEINYKESRSWNKFSISGEDPTWVYGIEKQLSQIFNKYKTINEVFHTKKGYGIYVLCAMGLFFAIYLPFMHSTVKIDKDSTIADFISIIAFNISIISTYTLWPFIFRKTFPVLEIPNSKHQKFKLIIPGFIIGIISSIIVGAIFLLVK